MSQLDKFTEDKNIIFAEPEWDRGIMRWLWDDDWYDGPMRGMMECHGKRYYAHCIDVKMHEIANPVIEAIDSDSQSYPSETITTDRIRYKWFCIYELTKDRQEYQEYWQELHSLIMDIRENLPGNTDVYGAFYMGREAADYIPLDLKSGRDGKVVGWFIEGHEV